MKDFYIKERHNPQIKKPYYIAYGQLTKKEARLAGNTIYGSNTMLSFSSKEEYEKKIEDLKNKGFNVSTNPCTHLLT